MDQAAVSLGSPSVQCLLQGIEDEVRAHRVADLPTDDAACEHVDDEGDVQPTLPGRDVGEVRDPELVRPLRLELPVDAIQRARRLGVADRRSHDLAAHHAAQPSSTHQSLARASSDREAFAPELAPDLVDAVDLHVGSPDTLDLRLQRAGACDRQVPLHSRPLAAHAICSEAELSQPADRHTHQLAAFAVYGHVTGAA